MDLVNLFRQVIDPEPLETLISNEQRSQELVDLLRDAYKHLYGKLAKPIFDRLPLVTDLLSSLEEIMKTENFETLILHLTTQSDEHYSAAKVVFDLCKDKYPSRLVGNLGYLLQRSSDETVRAMSVELLQNLFNELLFWSSLSESTRSDVKTGLLNCIVSEQNKSIIKKLGDAISELPADNGWPELMNFMFDRVGSDGFWLQESALLVFSRLGGDILVPHITRLHGVFKRCLENVGSADVRIAALSAVLNCIRCLKTSSDRDMFQDLLPGMMQCLEIKVLNDGDKETVQEELNSLIVLAKTEPRFFKGHLVVVIEGMLRIAEAESLQERTRHLAIEFVIILVEAREPAPRMMRDLPQLIISWLSAFFMRRKFRELISRLFAILMRMLLADIEDDAEWNEDEDESSNYRVGKEFLHRLATALGGKIAYKQLSEYLAKPDHKWQYHATPDHNWQKHLAALIALAQIAKGRPKEMIPNLKQVVTMVLQLSKDPDHPPVRWAAINAIGELCNHVGPSLLNQYHNRVLPDLDLALDDVNPRVQAHAVSVVLNLSSHGRPHILAPYLDGILKKLIEMPQNDQNIQVLTLVNSLETSTDVEERGLLAVQLGEMFEEPLAALTLYLVQCKLLICVGKENDGSVMKNLCHTIVTFFNVSCITTGWPELFSSVERWASGDKDLFKEAAMLILGQLTLVLTEGLNGGQEVTPSNGIGRFFLNAHGLKKLCSSFCIIFRKCTWSNCAPVTTQEALIEWAHQSHDTKLLRHLKKYFSRRQLVGFVSSAIEIAQSERLVKETRHLAIDFVITLGEGRHGGYPVLLIDKLFDILMSDIENEAASHWAENENDDVGESGNYSIVQKFLNRLAFKLDKYYVAWPRLKEYLASPDGKKRFAAIVALAPIFKVLKETKNEFGKLLAKEIYEYVDPRVRLAAIDATRLLSTDLDPDMQFQYNSRVLPALAEAIYKDPDRRVRFSAINAIHQFTDLDADLQFQYGSYVLPALAETICDLEYPELQGAAAAAMIYISYYPLDTSSFLHEIVSTLLELLRRAEIAADQTRIGAIRNLLEMFVKWIPDKILSIYGILHPDQQAVIHNLPGFPWWRLNNQTNENF